MSFYQELRPECKIECFYITRKQKKMECVHVDGCCDHCETVFEAMVCHYQFYSYQETRPSLSEQRIERGNERREMVALRRDYIEERGYKVQE